MATEKILITKQYLQDTADSIRTKLKIEDKFKVSEFASKIDEMEIANPPTKGFIINECDADGYPTDVSVVGMITIPTSYFYYAAYDNGANRGWMCRIGANLHLPDTLKSIGHGAFQSCTNLKITELPESITTLSDSVFYQATGVALTKFPSQLTEISNSCFYNCSNITATQLPENVKTIKASAFYNCKKLALTYLPETLTTLETSCFYGCIALAIKTIPSKVTVFNNEVFRGCSNITELTCLGAVTKFNSNAFYGCSKLAKFVLPNITAVPTLLYTNTFSNTPIALGTGYIYVPDNLKESMQTATNWSTYAAQIKGLSELEMSE